MNKQNISEELIEKNKKNTKEKITKIGIKRSTMDRLAKYGYVSCTWDYLLNYLLDHLDVCDGYYEIENEK